MKLEYSDCTRKGAVRRRNEDAVFAGSRESTGLFLVADGIGGGACGEEASGLIRRRYEKWWAERSGAVDFFRAVDEIKSLLFRVNSEIYEQYGQGRAGSTLVLLYIQDDRCLFLSSGDSRIYRARGLKCTQLTRDDIFENLTEKPRGYGPESNGMLVSAVGIRPGVNYSAKTDTVKRGDRFFLCSDGVYKYHSPGRLCRRLELDGAFSAPERVVRRISEEVEARGAGDNYSMVFVRAV